MKALLNKIKQFQYENCYEFSIRVIDNLLDYIQQGELIKEIDVEIARLKAIRDCGSSGYNLLPSISMLIQFLYHLGIEVKDD